VEVNIRADNMIRAAESMMEEKREKIPVSYLRQIERAILNLKEALAEGESDLIKNTTKDLRKALAIDN